MERLCKVLCGCFFFGIDNVDVKEEEFGHYLSSSTLAADQAPASMSASCTRKGGGGISTMSGAMAAIVDKTSYDVFLSHRGPDTKSTVVDVLRVFLESKGITCFVDYRMAEGVYFPSDLHQAICNSKVHIVVLSPRFAESSWCLEEAALIMDQLLQRSRGCLTAASPVHQHIDASSFVLPIFFGIQRADVRHPPPGSAYDLSKLHQSYSTAAQRARWSKALHDLSYCDGLDWSDTATNFQGQFTGRIQLRVEEILRSCKYSCPRFEWESMYSTQMEKAEKALCSHISDNNNIFSIGILGVHRSKFAKMLFNRFHKHFRAACILLDVKEQAKSREGLLKLQSTLLAELLNSPVNPSHIDNTEKGLAMLLDRLEYIKCLIVIDDVDDTEEQLRSLLVLDRHRLGRGSRLVLTSRFPCVFRKRAHVDETIELWTGTKDPREEGGRRLAICYESKDVHQGFIDCLSETFSMFGLCVSMASRAALLNVACEKQVSLILVILSQSFNVDSPEVLGMLEKASTSTDVKFVYVLYGLQSGINVSNISCTLRHPMVVQEVLCQSLFKNPLNFSVNFNRPNTLFDKGEFKSLISNIVNKHMQHEYKLFVTDFPVGLMKHQHEIENYICSSIAHEKSELKRIGILGMGGIGKTTIAKSLYNKIQSKFDGSVFLLNVRAQSKDVGLVPLQKAILDSVLGGDQVVKFSISDQGSQLLSKWLRGTHTLVILDDVDHVSQLDALLFPLDLARGSLVIITSRDLHILEAAGVDQIFEIRPLDSEDARKLFYWHAFLKPFPPVGLQDIAHKIIDACGGLPLSLQVIGAHVYNHANDHQIWEEALDHLQNGDHEIFKVLSVSLEGLENYQKEAFLDVCCFLIGKPHQTALRVWKGCGWNGPICLDVLKNKCLIFVDSKDGTIGMHNQIRDMGRCMAEMQQIKTHIWNAADATDIPHVALVHRLRGFAWISQEEEVANCDALAVQRLSRVKLLLLRNVQIDGEFPNLRWLQWQNSPFKVLPPGLWSAKKLCVLDLSGSTQLEALWRELDPISTTKVPEELQELNLSGCKNLTELPRFDPCFLHALEWFSLNGCERIDHLPNSIGSLHVLKFLDLSGCTSLQSLPDAIQDLQSLEKLLLSHCSLLDSLPQGIDRCCKLIEVCLDHTRLSTLPESLGNLKNLEKLTLNGCPNLASLPLSIVGLKMLRVCNLSDCPKLQKLPERFCELTNLEDLNLRNCAAVWSGRSGQSAKP